MCVYLNGIAVLGKATVGLLGSAMEWATYSLCRYYVPWTVRIDANVGEMDA